MARQRAALYPDWEISHLMHRPLRPSAGQYATVMSHAVTKNTASNSGLTCPDGGVRFDANIRVATTNDAVFTPAAVEVAR